MDSNSCISSIDIQGNKPDIQEEQTPTSADYVKITVDTAWKDHKACLAGGAKRNKEINLC